jgi:hypothetical protein
MSLSNFDIISHWVFLEKFGEIKEETNEMFSSFFELFILVDV